MAEAREGLEVSGRGTIEYEKRDEIAWVTLSRPAVLNAYNIAMRDELYEVLTAVRDDDEIRAMVVRGAGRAFCAGADLSEFGTAPSPTEARHVRFARDVWRILGELDIPTLAAIHGYCFGSGFELALFCDIRIARADAVFAFPEVGLGLIPAAGGTQTLPRVVGDGAALELMLTGRRITAEEALRLRVVARVLPLETFESVVSELASQLAGLPPAAAAAVKRAVRDGGDLGRDAALRLETLLAHDVERRRVDERR